MEGIHLETLVPDPQGNIALKDFSQHHEAQPGQRFRMEFVKYTGNRERREEILKAWRLYKTKKAFVEEDLFLKGNINLEGKEIKKENDDDF